MMTEHDMQHGVDYDGQDVIGYIATEKYNGCRAYWDGENMWSRGGIEIDLPDSWRAVLPQGVHLDGEIYDGVDGVYRCGSAIKYGRFTPSMKFMVFDCPSAPGDYQSRMGTCLQYNNDPVLIVLTGMNSSLSHAKALLRVVIGLGGEGLVLRNPRLKYAPGRTRDILKFKGINL
jgi:DNA ligase-1